MSDSRFEDQEESFEDVRSFWGVELIPGKKYTTTPEFNLHLTQAVLPASAKEQGRTVVTVVNDEEEEGKTPLTIASLKLDSAESQSLDLVFDSDIPITFLAVGKNPVHLTGHHVPDQQQIPPGYDFGSDDDEEIDSDEGEEFDEEDEEDEEEQDEAVQSALKRKLAQANGGNAKKAKVEQAEKPQQPAQKPKQAQQAQQPKQPQQPKQQQKQTTPTKDQAKPQQQQQKPQNAGGEQQKGGVGITTLRAGNGKTATKGKKVLVKYVGRLTSNGKVFDKSTESPFGFKLGVHDVIQGWDIGVEGMKEGEKRKLVIPAKLGYGAQGSGKVIPPNSSLTFDVELVKVVN